MCGLVGFTGSHDIQEKNAVLNKMMDTIVHRGPDSAGTYVDEHIAMGFRRLGLIDLEEGNQPIYSPDKKLVIMMNGEIYNYMALREELSGLGHEFCTRSDTEVVLHLYMEYGADMLNRLRGMFAFVVYNTETNALFAARDFFGIKPLHYAEMGGGLMFGSEIKSFLPHPSFAKELNLAALEHYLTFQYSVTQETFFKNVHKLRPGHYLTYENGKLNIVRYFKPEFRPEQNTLANTVTAIDDVVQDSIIHHKISDVEIGSFLSSGVDSSYVASCFKGEKTFTVGFGYEDYNEINYAKDLSESVGLQNINRTISKEEYFEALSDIQYHLDEPLADPSAAALYFVSAEASKHVKAVLSGEGADELFGGYNIYREPLDLKIASDLPRFLKRFLAKLASILPFSFRGKNFLIRAGKRVEDRFIGNASIFTKSEREKLLKNPLGLPSAHEVVAPLYASMKGYDDITKMQMVDINYWMPGDILQKADRMSMAHSLELRVPFLDIEVFKIASRIQTDFRVNRTGTKYAFRLAAKTYMPDSVAKKKKLGFPVPIRIWLREEKYYNLVKEAFQSEVSEKFFNTQLITALLDDHKDAKKDNSRKIWVIYMFLVWYDRFFGESEAAGKLPND